MEKHIAVDKDLHKSFMLDELNDMRTIGEHCDFMIKVQHEEIPVHMNVLAAGSKYFRAMFKHDTKERQQGYVEMKEADADLVKQCIHFIYTGKASVLDKNIEHLMHFATLMQLNELCAGLAKLLEKELSPETFFYTKCLANKYHCEQLEKKCDEFATKKFTSITVRDEFKQLHKKYVLFLISSKRTNASESDKCKAIIEWTKHDVGNRQKCLVEFLQSLTISKIASTYRRFLVENEPLVNESAECLKLLMVSFFQNANIEPRDWQQGESNAIFFFDGTSKALHSFQPEKRNWEMRQKMHSEMSLHKLSAVLLDDYIYVFQRNQTVYRLMYCDEGADWEKMVSMRKTYRKRPDVVVLHGIIYLVSPNETMEKYDPEEDNWEEVVGPHAMCFDSALVAADGHIYSIGGWNGNRIKIRDPDGVRRFVPEIVYDDVKCFDPSENKWSDFISINDARYEAAAVEYNNRIYVMGGKDQTNAIKSVEYYDAERKVWEVITEMTVPRCSFHAIVVNEKLYAVGGDQTGDCTIETMSAENNWEVIERLDGKTIQPVYLALKI